MEKIFEFFNNVDTYMYYPVLIIVLALGGLFFTFRTRFVQIRRLGDAFKLIVEKPQGEQKVSSFQALMVSTASRVAQVISSAFLLRSVSVAREHVFGCG